MDNEFYEIVDILAEKKAASYIAKTVDNISVKTNISQVIRDTSWIDKFEEMIPYLDDIIRNPRKFIVSEEEIIPVEKTKKITEESIKHLARHTSLIQDVDKDGNVQPLKLLNVFKEESTDLYENRFIYSLVTNSKIFLDDFLQNTNMNEKSKYLKEVEYSGQTVLNGEKINVKMNITNQFAESSEEDVINESIKERVEKIEGIFNDFLRSAFIKSLNNALPVRSPIKKTNVILKDQNFKKAIELWEFIETFDIINSSKVVTNIKEENSYNLADKMKISSYLGYHALNSVSKKEIENSEYKLGEEYLKKSIELYVLESHGNEKAFKRMLSREFDNARIKQEKLYDEIKSELEVNIINHTDRIKKSVAYLN